MLLPVSVIVEVHGPDPAIAPAVAVTPLGRPLKVRVGVEAGTSALGVPSAVNFTTSAVEVPAEAIETAAACGCTSSPCAYVSFNGIVSAVHVQATAEVALSLGVIVIVVLPEGTTAPGATVSVSVEVAVSGTPCPEEEGVSVTAFEVQLEVTPAGRPVNVSVVVLLVAKEPAAVTVITSEPEVPC